jgi:hypothetical protein
MVATTFDQKLFDRICERMAEGESLRAICKTKDYPAKRTVLRWVASDEELQKQYAKAQMDRIDHYAEQIVDIADECRVGKKVTTKANGDVETVEVDMVERARVQIDARKWICARMNPKKYGDRVLNEHMGEGGGAVIHKVEFEIVDPQDPGSSQA